MFVVDMGIQIDSAQTGSRRHRVVYGMSLGDRSGGHGEKPPWRAAESRSSDSEKKIYGRVIYHMGRIHHDDLSRS